MDTLLLDTATWDLTLDISGNIAVASNPYSLAQDAASACRLWTGEYWYNLTIGMPYDQILGQTPNFGFLKQQWVAQALTVPGVVSAQAFITSFLNREVTGQIQVTDSAGTVSVAAISTGQAPGQLFLNSPALSSFNNIMVEN